MHSSFVVYSALQCTLYILVMEVKTYRQVHADQARLERSTASLRRAKEIAALQSSRLPQPPVDFCILVLSATDCLQVAKRKMRRSNSCSDLGANRKGMKVVGGRNAPSLLEEQGEARGRGREELRPSQRLVRAGSSSKLFVR